MSAATPGAIRIAAPGYRSAHPGSGVGRIVTSFLAVREQPCWLVPSFSAPVMLLVNMAREGRGITWAPRNLVADDLLSGRLVRAGAEEWDIEIGICLFRSRARMNSAAERFWKAAQQWTADHRPRSA